MDDASTPSPVAASTPSSHGGKGAAAYKRGGRPVPARQLIRPNSPVLASKGRSHLPRRRNKLFLSLGIERDRISSALAGEFSKLVAKDLSYGMLHRRAYGSGEIKMDEFVRSARLPGYRNPGPMRVEIPPTSGGSCVQTGKAAGRRVDGRIKICRLLPRPVSRFASHYTQAWPSLIRSMHDWQAGIRFSGPEPLHFACPSVWLALRRWILERACSCSTTHKSHLVASARS